MKYFGMRLTCAAALIAVAGLASNAKAAIIMIDDFSQPLGQNAFQFVVQSLPGVAGSSLNNATGILGESRQLQLDLISTPFVFGFTSSSVFVADGVAAWDNASRYLSEARFIYDGVANLMLEPDGLDGVDLTDGGTNTAFMLDVLTTDLDLTIDVIIHSGAGNSTTVSTTLTGPAGPTSVVIDFADIIATTGAGADFSDVGAVELVLRGPESVDATIDNFKVIPEPASMALLGLGLAVIARRRNKA